MSIIAHNIKKLRTEKGMSQQEFGDLFDINRGSIGSYEENRAEPKLETILKICKYFNLSVDDFLTKKMGVKIVQETIQNQEVGKATLEKVLSLEERIKDLESKMDKISKIINLN